MKKNIDKMPLFYFQECSSVKEKYTFYELIMLGDKTLLSIGANVEKVIEVRFYEDITKIHLELNELLQWIEEGRRLATGAVEWVDS